MRVVFVGCDPGSNRNDYVGRAFSDNSPSTRRLMSWLSALELREDDCGFVNTTPKGRAGGQVHKSEYDLDRLYKHVSGHIIVALGNVAADALNRLGQEYYKLPHPSPRNFQMNNQAFVDNKLLECKQYIKRQLNESNT